MIVAYIRVSTDNQEQKGSGLDTQRQHIIAYTAANNLNIDYWYSDVASGAAQKREGLNALRKAVENGSISKVLVYRMDRLSRDAHLSEVLYRELKKNAEIISVSERLDNSFTGDLMRRILAAFSDYERAIIAARTKYGRRQAIQQKGTYGGGPGVYGYRPVGTKQMPGNGKLEVIEKEAKAIKKVFELKEQDLSLRKISQELNKLGYKTKQNADFTSTQVQRILKREKFYRAQNTLNKFTNSVNPAHSAIIDLKPSKFSN